jgi:hypothetical protein
MNDTAWNPITVDNCSQVRGPFYHGTRADLSVGEFLSPGFPSKYEGGRVLCHIYFSGLIESAVWGAELASAFAGSAERGRIYLIEPTGAFEDDPNLTNNRFPGNPTKSYRTRDPIKIVGILSKWQGHAEEDIQRMVSSLKELKRSGRSIIED